MYAGIGQKLTSFQDFPRARRGQTGALGFANDMELESATSLGCNVESQVKLRIEQFVELRRKHRGLGKIAYI